MLPEVGNPFIIYVDKETMDLVLTHFFRTTGYIDQNVGLDFTTINLTEDSSHVHLEANVITESVN